MKKLFIFQEMKLFNLKHKKLLFFRRTLCFSSLFLQIFSFFMLSFLHVFICLCFQVLSLLIALAHFTVSSLFVRYFVLVLLYHECYGFERSFFTLHSFMPFSRLPWASSSALKVAELPAEVRNTDSAHLLV